MIGLQVARTGPDGSHRGVWNTLADVLIPLADAFALPAGCGIAISPKLLTEWIEEFEPGDDSTEAEPGRSALPKSFLQSDGGDGIALAEFRRMTLRHIALEKHVGRTAQAHKEARAWVDTLCGPGFDWSRAARRDFRDDLKQRLAVLSPNEWVPCYFPGRSSEDFRRSRPRGLQSAACFLRFGHWRRGS